jgi:adenine-specific DNA-methyltransferase
MSRRQERLAIVRDHLGPPAWETGTLLLYQGDCLELMSKLPDSIFDLTITSPPYNIGKEYEKPLSLNNYILWCERWMKAVHRLTAANGAFWLNLGYVPVPERGKAIPLPYLLWERNPFFLIQEVVWNYGAGIAGKRFFSPRNEKWLWGVKHQSNYVFNLDDVRDPDVKYPNQKKNGKVRVNAAGKNPTDVWRIPKVTTGADRTGQRASKERTAHPAQFPQAVIDRIVRASSNANDLLFDPFSGSGTTGAVATLTGRSCVLFELLPDYVEMTIRRLKKVNEDLESRQVPLLESTTVRKREMGVRSMRLF